MIGSRLSDRYELLGELGRGGMAVVYRAHDPRLDRQVAIKMVATDGLAETAVERFEREAQLVAGLDHPAVVPIFDFGRHDDWLFFVMPVVEGVTLHRLFRDRGLAVPHLLEIVAQVAEVVDYSAAHGVVHRDLKPENIMVALDRDSIARVWVMDFGLALTDATSRLTRTGNLPGTLAYLSPEQVLSDELDARSDLYSLAIILYEGLAGQPPFGGSPATVLYRIVHAPPPPLGGHGISHRLDALIRRCLAKSPDDRPASGQELADALRAIARETVAAHGVEATTTETLLLGRQHEMEQLRQALHRALGNACQLILIGGERGLGKSRLLRELEVEARRLGVTVAHGRFSPADGGTSYDAFGELIQDVYRQSSSSSTGAGSSSALAELAPELVSLMPALGELSDHAADAIASEARGMQQVEPSHLYELISQALGRLVERRPVVFMIEHLHAADASVELLQYLVRRLGPTPCLFVATYQPAALGRRHPLKRLLRSFREEARCVVLDLQPLDEDDHRRLIEHLLGGPVHEDAARRLYDATEGNPLFAEELARTLIDTGALVADERAATLVDGWLGGESLLPRDLPATIQQALEARLERLDDRLTRLLGMASVLSRRFEYRDLEGLVRDTSLASSDLGDLDDAIDTLVARGLLVEDRRRRGDWLRFQSALLREVVYDRLPRRKRRRLHRRAGEVLEARFTERPERAYPRLLHHFAEGDVADKAILYGRRLARQSLVACAWDDAVRAARTALEFVEDEVGDEAAYAEGGLRRILGEAHAGSGEVDAAIREMERAVRAFERAESGQQAAEAARWLTEIAWRNRRLDILEPWLETGLDLARRHGANDERIALLTLAATAANLRGEAAGARRFLDEARRLRAPEVAAVEPTAGPIDEVHVGMSGRLISVEPATVFSVQEAEVLGNVFETLVTVDADGRITPTLCRAVSSADDGRVFTFQLPEDLVFSDGSPVDAEAVRRSLDVALLQGDMRHRTALAPVVGVAERLAGEADAIAGLVVVRPFELRVELRYPLAMFPALLAAIGLAVCRHLDDGTVIGTGPFTLGEMTDESWTLERNPRHRRSEALANRLIFHLRSSSRQLVADWRDRRLDIVRDLAPPEIEALLDTVRYRGRVFEATLPDVGFVLWNVHGPRASDRALRALLANRLDVRDLVWRSLARFATPATAWIPPGVPGHDPEGQRPRAIDRFEAIEAMQAFTPLPVRLRALIHPAFAESYRALTELILGEWSLLGVEIEAERMDLGAMAAREVDWQRYDIVFSRWMPDYVDPDAYCAPAFHTRDGLYGPLVGCPELDQMIDDARLESRPSVRERLYRRIQRFLIHESRALPLFHEVEYRAVMPHLGGVRLQAQPPYVDYRRVGRLPEEWVAEPVAQPRSGHLRVALASRPESLDPADTLSFGVAEVTSNLFETLVRIDGAAEIVPHLAESIETSADGRRLRVTLRDIRFHDGRKLGARDVRYSFERLTRRPDGRLDGALRHIEGALAMCVGQANELSGVRVLSDRELEICLSSPLSAFLALLSAPYMAIVPEGSEQFGGSWREGCVGTGPFRLVAFEPGRRVELAAHTEYWRGPSPHCERLTFDLGISPMQALAELETGRAHVVGPLVAPDVERVSRDPDHAAGLREHPEFSTCFVVLNRLQGPLADPRVRGALHRRLRSAARRLAPELGRLGVHAERLIPPVLAIGEGGRPETASDEAEVLRGVRLEAALHPRFSDVYRSYWHDLVADLEAAGVEIVVRHTELAPMVEAASSRSVDLIVSRWIADVPDAASFADLFHSDEGLLGRPLCEPRLDRLIEAACYESDPATRQSLYRELERLLADEALVVPLFHEQLCRVAAKGVDGLRLRYGWPEVAYEELALRR